METPVRSEDYGDFDGHMADMVLIFLSASTENDCRLTEKKVKELDSDAHEMTT